MRRSSAAPRAWCGSARQRCVRRRAASCATTPRCSCWGSRAWASTSCCRHEELMPPLSIMLWLPAFAGVLGALLSWLARRTGVAEPVQMPVGETSRKGTPFSRLSTSGALALLGALATLGLAIGYIADYSPSHHGLAHVTDVTWIAELGIHYKLGVDGLNVFMVGLTALLFAVAVIAANLREWE